MENKNYKICDVIKFTNIDLFSYDDEEAGVIELEKEYIIVDMFDGVVVVSDGELEFIIEDISLQVAVRIRRMRFRVGDKLKILNLKGLKFAEETLLKQNGVYEVVSVVIREGIPIIFDGENEISLLPEELLFVKKMRKPKNKVQDQSKKKGEYKHAPSSAEIGMLHDDIRNFTLTSLIDKSLDERNFDLLKRIVENNYKTDNE